MDDNLKTVALQDKALVNLSYIRQTMETSRRFTAVPGWGGVWMGVVGLLAAWSSSLPALEEHWVTIWVSAAVVGATVGIVFLFRKIKHQQSNIIAATAQRFMWSLCPPLLSGLLLTVALWSQGIEQIIPCVWLLTYGAGVSATASFTIRPVAWLGCCFLFLGFVSIIVPAEMHNGLLALGFGGLHMVFGLHIARYHGG